MATACLPSVFRSPLREFALHWNYPAVMQNVFRVFSINREKSSTKTPRDEKKANKQRDLTNNMNNKLMSVLGLLLLEYDVTNAHCFFTFYFTTTA